MRQKSLIGMICLVMLLMPIQVFGASDGEHWVYPELKEYKQQIVGARDAAGNGGVLTVEEWDSFQAAVLDARQLDQPIQPKHWATMLKMSLKLPQDQLGSLLDSYVYGLAESPDAESISREAAVGGLVKLLSIQAIDAVWTSGDADASSVFSDFDEISDHQQALVKIAYREGMLDGTVKDQFRPQAALTHAEAISMMYRVNGKFREGQKSALPWPEQHWSVKTMDQFLKETVDRDPLKGFIAENMPTSEADLKKPIRVDHWHQLLLYSLGLPVDKKDDTYSMYTYGMAEGDYLSRDVAVIGMMKIGGPLRDATEQERAAAEEAFTDFRDAVDTSKLALAYHEGLITGYGDGSFKPQQHLTYGEAFVLAVRLNDRGTTGDE